MISALADLYQELEQIDVTRDLEQKSLHVSASGLSWVPVPVIDGYSNDQLLRFYYHMSLTRATDLEIVKMSRKGIAQGKHLPCTGNEATAVGATSALREGDWTTLAIRDLAAFLVRGVPPSRAIAQACGRMEGLSGGWDGSLHMGHQPSRVVGLISHLGTLIPLGVGLSFGEKYKGTDNVALAFVGDGTTSTGDVHEALNMAATMHIPLVLVIENNQWAFGTPNRLEYATPTLSLRALGYGKNVEGYWIDGTNVLTVYDTVSRALARARGTHGVTIIEAASMRMDGHSLADPFTTYVPAEQLAIWKTKDPIATFRDRLVKQRIASVEELRDLDQRVADEVRAAAIKTEQSPHPSAQNARDIEAHVFAPSPVHDRPLATPPPSGKTMTYHQAIREALMEELDRDPNVFMVGEDIGISNGAFKITEGFSKRYDNLDWNDAWKSKDAPFEQRRIIDSPIAEAGYVGLALGAVLTGLRPIVEFQYADFASEAFKMIVNYAATQTVRGMGPVGIVFRFPSGWATNTSIYHSVNPESWFASTPGLKIVAPSTPFDARGLMAAAVADPDPVLYYEHIALYRDPRIKQMLGEVAPAPLPLGRAALRRHGEDLAIVSYGAYVHVALRVAEKLAADGIDATVLDLRSLVPLDRAAVLAVARHCHRVLIVHEDSRTGGIGESLAAVVQEQAFEWLDAPVRIVGALDTPVPYSPPLEEAYLPSDDQIERAARLLAAY